MARPEVTIAVLAGSVEDGLLRRMGVPAGQLLVVRDALTGRVAVESGLASGLALSSPGVRWMAARQDLGLTEIAAPFRQSQLGARERLGYGAFEFRPGDGAPRAAWDEVLRTHVGSPEHLALIAESGFTLAELPGPLASPGTSPR